MNSTKPLVSISCITYNHAKYIRDAIESFLMQKTNFTYEILIHDDASTDGTENIIREYKKKYPDIIKPLYETENQWSKGIRGSAVFNFPRALGKYIAMCEGDDYWTDPYKLQKQVGFLEINEEYGLVHGDCNFYFEEKKRWEYNANKNLTNNNPVFSKEDIFYQLIDASYKVRTATVVFRKELLKKIKPNDLNFLMGDTPLWLDFSLITRFKYFDEVFAVYRITSESASRTNNRVKQLRFSLSMAEMRIYYTNKYGYPINQKLKTRYNGTLLAYKLLDMDYKEVYPLIEPSAYQRLKFKALKRTFLRPLLLAEYMVANYLSATRKHIAKMLNPTPNSVVPTKPPC